ncbi:hypothetical protein Bca4012_086275 [Brassica carinata]
MLVYDITKRETFDHIPRWLEELRAHADKNIVIILIGNKSDLEDQRAIPTEDDAKEFAEKEGLFFLETSALNATNVENSFNALMSEIFNTVNKKSLSSVAVSILLISCVWEKILLLKSGCLMWNLSEEANIGVDPWCVSVDTANRWSKSFAKKKQRLIPTTTDLVDEVWKNRPDSQMSPVVVHPLEFAGRSAFDKLEELRSKLKQESARGYVIAALDEVAWLYNICGTDVTYCPAAHALRFSMWTRRKYPLRQVIISKGLL